MNETSLAESTSAIDVASRMFGRNRPETTCMVMSCATLDDCPYVVCDAKLGAAGCRLRCTKMSSATWCAVEQCRLRFRRLVGVKLDVECDSQVPEKCWVEVVRDQVKQLMLAVNDQLRWELD